MSNVIVTRRAMIEDAKTLSDFNCKMAMETENKALDTNRALRGVERMINEPGRGFYLLLCEAEAIQASLMITYEWSDWRDADFWWIQSVYVIPQARRQGYYSRLYSEIKAMAKDAGSCGIRLYAERGNHSAQETYTSLGMHKCAYSMFEESFN